MSVIDNPEIFKAYDIRGLYGAEMDEATAHAIGRAFARVLGRLRGKSPAELLTAQLTTPIGVRPSAGASAFPRDPAAAARLGLGPAGPARAAGRQRRGHAARAAGARHPGPGRPG